MPKSRLRKLSAEADRLIKLLKRFERSAQDRLAPTQSAPLISGATWAKRIDIFSDPTSPRGHAPLANNTQISQTVTAFTDDPEAEVGFRQTPNGSGGHITIFDIHNLRGSFLSLAIGLGEETAKTLGKDDLVRLHIESHSEQDIEILVRLNLRSGPNTEHSIRHYIPGQTVEFDLFYIDFEPERMSDAWIDFMLPPHQMNRIELRDMVISKLSRADI